MPITADDLKKYAATYRPENDTDPSGGGVDTLRTLTFTQMTANAQIALVSNGPDTRQVTVKGRNPAGERISETVSLNGTSEVLTSATFERLHSVEVASTDAARTITVRQGAGGSTLGTIAPNKRGFWSLFIDAASEASPVTRYEKEFWRNEHASLTLTNAKVTLTADPSAKIRIGIATTKNDTVQVANRKTQPSGITFVDDGIDQDVPGGTLEAGVSIGVWIEQSLAADDAPVRSTYTTRLRGMTV